MKRLLTFLVSVSAVAACSSSSDEGGGDADATPPSDTTVTPPADAAEATPGDAAEAPPGESEDPAEVEASTPAASAAGVGLQAEVAADADFAAGAGISASSTLDISLSKRIVRLDELRSWQPDTPVGTLFHAIRMRIFIVLDGGQVTSAVLMGKNDDGSWRVVSHGHKARAARIASARAQSIAKLGAPDRPMFLIEVPALYAEFVSERKGDTLYLTPTDDVAGLQAGTPVNAADAMKALQAIPPRAFSGN
jgi:hypothetical protein